MLQSVREFTYQKLTPEEQAARGILGRLVGVMADFKHPTRNDRLYNEELWDKTFENPIVKEKLENRCMFGELGHPTDRTEIDMEKIALCLAEYPKKLPDGTVNGVFDILNTPNGRILKTLCDYGCKIGVSSRGTGEVFEDYNSGKSTVDADSYECECWDAVLLPAVKAARPIYVTESLNRKSLREALNEAIQSENADAKRVIEDTLKELNIDYKPETVDNISANEDKKTAEDNGVELFDSLQESLKQNKALESKVLELQEKLSVCYAKEAKIEQEVMKYKNTIITLSESAKTSKALKVKVDSLTEQLSEKEKQINILINDNKALKENINKKVASDNKLTESLNSKDLQVKQLSLEVKNLQEQINLSKQKANIKESKLVEQVEELKQNSMIKAKEYSMKLEKANSLTEHYRKIAKSAVDRYIDTKARMIGVSSQEIKNKLDENYSFTDIDKICESLKSYKLNISKLPFNIQGNTTAHVKVTESKETLPIMPGVDDEIDPHLLRMSGLD